MEYPETRKDDIVDVYHGVEVEDPYRWLEDIDDSRVQEWISQQNELTHSILDSYPGRAEVRERTLELMKHESMSSLEIREIPDGARFFYLYKGAQASQPTLCYQDGEDGRRTTIVDPIELNAEGSVSIDRFFPSWNGRYVAFTTSEFGTEDSVLQVYDLSSEELLSERIPRVRWVSLAWNQESKGFYYTRYPLPGTSPREEMNYSRHVYYHELGSDYLQDPKVFGDGRLQTEMYYVYTHSRNDWILLRASRFNSNDIYLVRSSEDLKTIPLVESDSGISYASLSEESVFLVTFVDAPNGRIVRYALDEFSHTGTHPEGTVVIEEGEHSIWHVSTNGHLVYSTLREASHEFHIHDIESGSHLETVKFPSPVSITGIADCPITQKLYLSTSSFISPDAIRTYSVGDGFGTFFAPEVNLDSTNLTVELVWYKSKDGTNVSMFLVSAARTKPSRDTPVIVRGYGNGGIPYTPMFYPEYVIWLEHGGLLAVPHIRGGGEYGKDWHELGRGEYKQNTFDDFIAAIEWLHENEYGMPETTAIMGRSAGGLLVGAVATQRPGLFSSVYCGVPLLDMIRYVNFTVARNWMSEWGDPELEEEFGWLLSYSPYHRVVSDTHYPAVLVYTAVGDIRCDPSHAMKMAARMQSATISEMASAPILLRVDREAGHGVGLSIEKLVEIRSNQVIFHARHTGLDFSRFSSR